MRLRQIVVAARHIEPLAGQLTETFGLGTPYRDPGVGDFGLENVVFTIGDQFLEIVAPKQDDTAAGRFMDRWGEGGYMVILQTGDLEGLRNRARKQNIRRVWDIDRDEITASHLHPRDMGGAILSVDEPHPAESWLWAGPGWQERTGEGLVRAATGVSFQSPAPEALGRRWSAIIDQPYSGGMIALSDARLHFGPDENGRGEGVSAYTLKVAGISDIRRRATYAGLMVEGDSVLAGGVRFQLETA